jgi:capsule polysaccharide export protein KpsC/LpsZ
MDKHALSTFSPSVCTETLADRRHLNPEVIERGRAGIHALTTARIGGDCWSAMVDEPALSQATVLVVAPSVLSDTFDRMIGAVLNEQTPKKVAVLAPAGLSPTARDALALLAAEHGMVFIAGPVNAWSLLDKIAALYTVDDELGFLALLKAVSVRCFGNPFYAGYGLTEDDAAVPQRAGRRTLEEVFAAACLTATTYFDPYSKAASSFEDACATLGD